MKISQKQKAKLVKEQSRKHRLPPNKQQADKSKYKRDKKVDLDE